MRKERRWIARPFGETREKPANREYELLPNVLPGASFPVWAHSLGDGNISIRPVWSVVSVIM
jgi:hypothetical protein